MTLADAIQRGDLVLTDLGEWSLVHGGLAALGLDIISASDGVAVGFARMTPIGRSRWEQERKDIEENLRRRSPE